MLFDRQGEHRHFIAKKSTTSRKWSATRSPISRYGGGARRSADATAVRFSQLDRTSIAACGTAYMPASCTLLVRTVAHLPVEVDIASRSAIATCRSAGKPRDLRVAWGETADTLASLRSARAHKQRTLGHQRADLGVARETTSSCDAGRAEVGVTSTSVPCRLVALAYLAVAAGRAGTLAKAIKRASCRRSSSAAPLQRGLALEPPLERFARDLASRRTCFTSAAERAFRSARRRAEAEGNSYLHAERYAARELSTRRCARRREHVGDHDHAARQGVRKDVFQHAEVAARRGRLI